MKKNKELPLIAGILVLGLIFGSIGFGIGYYQYSSQLSQEKLERQKQQELLNALVKAQEDKLYSQNEDNEQTVSNYGETISDKTTIIYKTEYTQCQSIIEEREQPNLELIGLNEKGFEKYIREKNPNSEVEGFSKDEVIVTIKENKVCPNHYLISVNDGYIAIYKYDEEGNKHLVEQTELSVKHLPVVDQEKLQRGIFVDTLEDVNQLLEDFSS